jgi:hypothetical protein
MVARIKDIAGQFTRDVFLYSYIHSYHHQQQHHHHYHGM